MFSFGHVIMYLTPSPSKWSMMYGKHTGHGEFGNLHTGSLYSKQTWPTSWPILLDTPLKIHVFTG
jgi:hypothetical protein